MLCIKYCFLAEWKTPATIPTLHVFSHVFNFLFDRKIQMSSWWRLAGLCFACDVHFSPSTLCLRNCAGTKLHDFLPATREPMDALREKQRVYDLEWEAGIPKCGGKWMEKNMSTKKGLKPQHSWNVRNAVMFSLWAVEDSAEAAEEELDDGLKDRLPGFGAFDDFSAILMCFRRQTPWSFCVKHSFGHKNSRRRGRWTLD